MSARETPFTEPGVQVIEHLDGSWSSRGAIKFRITKNGRRRILSEMHEHCVHGRPLAFNCLSCQRDYP
jgi:hypothetical protein